MKPHLVRAAIWLHHRAENVAVLMLAVMFVAFIAQVLFRYLLNLPTGWSSELTIIMWLWLILWGAAFVTREDEEIRFDVIYGAVRGKPRWIMKILSAVALLFLYGYSFPAVWDFVTFMKVQKTSYLDIRYDYLFSIYIVFVIAILIRYAWILLNAVRGRNEDGITRGNSGP